MNVAPIRRVSGVVAARAPGRYALVCFIANRDGKGRPLFLDGMLKEVEIR
jgi:hypothetical protein